MMNEINNFHLFFAKKGKIKTFFFSKFIKFISIKNKNLPECIEKVCSKTFSLKGFVTTKLNFNVKENWQNI